LARDDALLYPVSRSVEIYHSSRALIKEGIFQRVNSNANATERLKPLAVHLCNDMILFSHLSHKQTFKLEHALELSTCVTGCTSSNELTVTGKPSTSVSAQTATSFFSFGTQSSSESNTSTVSVNVLFESSIDCKAWHDAIECAVRMLCSESTAAATSAGSAAIKSKVSSRYPVFAAEASKSTPSSALTVAGAAVGAAVGASVGATVSSAKPALGPKASAAQDFLEREIVSLDAYKSLISIVVRPIQSNNITLGHGGKSSVKSSSARGLGLQSLKLSSGSASTVNERFQDANIQQVMSVCDALVTAYGDFVEAFKVACASSNWR
jgi:hypothetical protein